MDSVRFDGEDESQPSASNGKKYELPRKLLDDFGAVTCASVPRKRRSVIKKRGRESVASPLRTSRKQRHMSTGVETLRRVGAKKSKLNMNQGHITKDEEEVAETLYALADMFSDAKKASRPGLDNELSETKSSASLEAGSSMNAVEDNGVLTLQEESGKISSNINLDAACHSLTLVNSTAQVAKFKSQGDAQLPELPSSMQPATISASGVKSNFSLCHRLRVSTVEMIPNSEETINLEQVTATKIQYGKNYYPKDDKSNGKFQLDGVLSSETQRSCQRLPAWFESTKSASQPCVTENSVAAVKHTRVAVESKKSWKRCSAHVYIGRLIKVLQISERKEGLLEKPPTQLTSCGDAELRPQVATHNQTMGINGRNGGENDSAEMQNNILLHKRPLQDQQLVSENSGSCSSSKQGYNFLSLGTGACGSGGSEGINRTAQCHEAPKQYHASYMQSQNRSAMPFLLPQNGYSSTFHGHTSALAPQQVLLPHYLSNGFSSQMGQQLEPQQRKWAAQVLTQYNTGGAGASPHLPDWKYRGRDSSSMLNYAHTLFPQLQAALGSSKYQQFSPSQQQLMAINSSLPTSNAKRHNRHLNLPLGFERNGTALYPENFMQLQLPCNPDL